MLILFAWDFHGVLEKDNEYAVLEITNRVLKEFKVKRQMTMEQCRLWYGLSWRDYFKNLYPGQQEKLYIRMCQRSLEIQQAEPIIQKYIKPMDGAEEVLSKIQKSGHSNIVISNSDPISIVKFVQMIKLTSYFENLIGVDSQTLKTKKLHSNKANYLKKFVKNRSFDKIVVIGDRESDILAGQTVGAITYLFTGSKCFTDYDLIEEIKPNYVIERLGQVLREV